jgi:hypothetical protein
LKSRASAAALGFFTAKAVCAQMRGAAEDFFSSRVIWRFRQIPIRNARMKSTPKISQKLQSPAN